MGLGELLDRIRELYTTQLASAVEQQQRRAGVRVLTDVALCDEHGEVVGAGALGLPLRLDLVALSGEAEAERFSVDSERILAFEPISFAWSNGLRVVLHPFAWDNLTARLPAPARSTGWEPLVGWFREWFREEEDGGVEPLGVVHFLSDPELVDGSVRFSGDLGSAPVEAFEGLLDAVAALEVAGVVIGDEA